MRYLFSAAVLAAAIALLTAPTIAADLVGSALTACLEVIVPSLFAFTVLAVYLQSSGLYRVALRPLTLPLSKLFGIDEELCAVFVLGNIGGYPVGARLLCTLVNEQRLSSAHAGRLLCCCYGSGPSFIIAITGMRIFGSVQAGAVIFAACFCASLLIGVFVCRFGERITLLPAAAKLDLTGECFVNSVMSAGRVMYTVCAMIIGFAAVTAVMDITGLRSALGELLHSQAMFDSLLEISNIQKLPADNMPLCAALLSFGGICVLLQVCALTSTKVPMRGFLLSRIPAAGISAGATWLMCSRLDLEATSELTQAVYAPAELTPKLFSVNAGMSVCVLMMCALLIASTNKGTSQQK